MSITDELREYATNGSLHYCSDYLAIADRIDAEHESACAEAYGNGVMSVPIALDESAWVKLPVDADGVPIHVGDELDGLHYEDGTVTGIQYWLAANGIIRELVAVRPHGWDTATWHDPEEYRHRHAPTVEDVLREFAEKITDSQIPNVHPTYEEAIAEYAAKLRLAEGVDE